MPDQPESGPVPRALRWVSIAGLLVGIVLIFVGGWRVGVTWDEPIHVQRLNTYLETGWYLGDGQLVDGRPGPAMTQQYVYAPATMLFLHGLAAVTGVEHWDSAAVTADAYVVRHIGIGVIGVLGILAVIGLGRLLFRRWDWALVTGAILAVMPMWTGYSMFNLKDVPVGTGYTIVTLGLALIARADQGPHWRIRLAGPGCIAIGTLLAVGTRPGIWTGLAAGTAVLVGCLLLRPTRGTVISRLRDDAWRFRDLLLGYVAAWAGLYLIDPKVFGSPIHALFRSAFSSANFLGVKSSWTFVPIGVFLQVPILMLVFTAIGVWVAAKRLITVRLRPGIFETRLLLVVAQVFTLPLIGMIHGAALYGDLRQVLFAAPATAVLVAVGIHRLVAAARARADRGGPRLASTIACLALVVPLVEQASLFPYDYAYYNPFATIARVPTHGDYYRASGREMAQYLPTDGRVVCSPAADRHHAAMRLAHLDGWVDCRTAEMSPIAPYLRRGSSVEQPPLDADQFWAVNFGSNAIAKNCVKVKEISRRFRWSRLHLAILARCTRPWPVLSSAPVRITASSYRGLDLPDLGWLIPLTDGTPVGLLSTGSGPASMKFRLARQFAGHDVTFLIETARPTTVPSVTFGGTPVQVRATGDQPGFTITIPRAVVDAATQEAMTLEFLPQDAGALDMKVISVRAQIGTR